MDEHAHDAAPATLPPATTTRDPGSRTSRLLAVVITLVAAAIVIGWQNIDTDTQAKLLGSTPPERQVAADEPAPGSFGPIDIQSRLFVRAVTMYAGYDDMDDVITGNFAPGSIEIPEDRVRAIIMTAEYTGPEAALERIEDARDTIQREHEAFDPGGGPYEQTKRVGLVLEELDTLEAIYTQGQAAVTDDTRARFDARYGVVGRAATTHGLGNTDPRREPVVTGFIPIALFLLGIALGAITAFLAGMAVLVIWIITTFTAKPKGRKRFRFRFTPPAPGGSVFLETYAVFVIGFIVMSVGTTALALHVDPVYAAISLPLQWVLLLTVFWALARGMRFRDWRHAMGLHRGEGVFKEIGVGIGAYIATVPFYTAAAVVTLLLLVLYDLFFGSSTSGYGDPLTNPIMDLFASADVLTILIVFSLATLWAPITEELIFRGALHRHFRARLSWIGAALMSALLFAFMHSYGPLMVTPLITLAVAFSFVREWRGSIIASITMHFIHNFTLLCVILTMILLIRDPF